MRMHIDVHSARTRKLTGFERFTKAVSPVLCNEFDWLPASYGSGRVARALNFLAVAAASKNLMLFPTNPPLLWRKKQLARSVFIVHDIFPVIRPDLCQPTTAHVYKNFLCDMLEYGHVLTVSRFTSEAIEGSFRVAQPPVVGNVVSDLSGEEASPIARTVSGGYLLAVGTVEPRKNYGELIKAYSEYRKSCKAPLPLVIVGRQGWKSEEACALISETSGVIWLSTVGDRSLKWLYENCIAFVSASIYEGFNMPAFEALRCGATVIVPRKSAPLVECPDFGFLAYGASDELVDLLLRVQERDGAGATGQPDWSLFSPQKVAARIDICCRSVASQL